MPNELLIKSAFCGLASHDHSGKISTLYEFCYYAESIGKFIEERVFVWYNIWMFYAGEDPDLIEAIGDLLVRKWKYSYFFHGILLIVLFP